jgi:hypothetical protein
MHGGRAVTLATRAIWLVAALWIVGCVHAIRAIARVHDDR